MMSPSSFVLFCVLCVCACVLSADSAFGFDYSYAPGTPGTTWPSATITAATADNAIPDEEKLPTTGQITMQVSTSTTSSGSGSSSSSSSSPVTVTYDCQNIVVDIATAIKAEVQNCKAKRRLVNQLTKLQNELTALQLEVTTTLPNLIQSLRDKLVQAGQQKAQPKPQGGNAWTRPLALPIDVKETNKQLAAANTQLAAQSQALTLKQQEVASKQQEVAVAPCPAAYDYVSPARVIGVALVDHGTAASPDVHGYFAVSGAQRATQQDATAVADFIETVATAPTTTAHFPANIQGKAKWHLLDTESRVGRAFYAQYKSANSVRVQRLKGKVTHSEAALLATPLESTPENIYFWISDELVHKRWTYTTPRTTTKTALTESNETRPTCALQKLMWSLFGFGASRKPGLAPIGPPQTFFTDGKLPLQKNPTAWPASGTGSRLVCVAESFNAGEQINVKNWEGTSLPYSSPGLIPSCTTCQLAVPEIIAGRIPKSCSPQQPLPEGVYNWGTCGYSTDDLEGTTCVPTCKFDHDPSGTFKCTNGVYTGGACNARCFNTPVPKGQHLRNWGTCFQGRAGQGVPHNTICRPKCADGYEPTGDIKCEKGVFVRTQATFCRKSTHFTQLQRVQTHQNFKKRVQRRELQPGV